MSSSVAPSGHKADDVRVEVLPPTSSVRVVKGWKKGPYNRLQDPLPYDTLVPTSTTSTSTAAPAPAGPGGAFASTAAAAAAGGTGGSRAPSLGRIQSKRTSLTQVLSSDTYATGASSRTEQAAMAEAQARVKADFVEDEGLIPLPFQPPTVWQYVYDIAAGTWELVLYVLVMLLAIMLETNARYFRAGKDFDRWWVRLYKFVVVSYPAGIMVLQFTILCEYTLRKYLYFRMLSFGILVQYERRRLWQSWYFVFFICVWVILNVWAWWGLVAWWSRNGKDGPEVLSFAVFAVVNVVSFHLLVYYKRLMDAEKHMLKPLQAYLLPDVVLVSENAVKKEGWRLLRAHLFGYCWPGPKRFDVEWVRGQGVHLPRGERSGRPITAEALEEAATAQGAKVFDDNNEENAAVAAAGTAAGTAPKQEAGMERKAAVAEAMEGSSEGAGATAGVALGATAAAAASVVAGAAAAASVTGVSEALTRVSYKSTLSEFHSASESSAPPSVGGAAAAAALGPGPVAEAAEEDDAKAAAVIATADVSNGSEESTGGEGATAAPAPAAATPSKKMLAAAGAGAFAAGRATWGAGRRCCVCCFRCYCACCCWGARLCSPANYHSGLYALPMATMAAFSWHRVWPFRRDPSFLRLLFLTMFLSSWLIAGGIVYGAWLVARSPPVCQWGLDACYDCNLYQEEYVQYDQVCDAGGYNISKAWSDPDYFDPNCPGGRTWFTNGVWNHNSSAVLPQRNEYQNVTGRALLNGYLGATMSYYAYADGFEGLQKGFEGQFIKRFTSLFTTYGMTQFEFTFIDDTAILDTQFIVTGTGRDVYMIFRGTDGITDTFITDLSGTCKTVTDFGPEVCIHSGFIDAYRMSQQKVFSSLIKVISGLNTTRTPDGATWQPSAATGQPFTLWLTGHSLGGALATLTAMDLTNRGLKIAGVYTYGSPRVGDSRFKSMYGSSGLADVTWRYVHRSDAITQVPPGFMGFVHVTPPTLVQDNRCVGWPADEPCAEKGLFGGCKLSAGDHFIPGYMSNLRSCVAAAKLLPNCTELMMPLWAQMGQVSD